MAERLRDNTTTAVDVGGVVIGGGAPIAVQAMTDTPTADVDGTVRQVLELAAAGAELVRVAVDTRDAASAVPEIRARLDGAGCPVPLIGDLHFNGHRLLAEAPGCAAALAKIRVNPGNLGPGNRHDANFAALCAIARDHGIAVRIGVNGGSLDRGLVTELMRRNAERNLGLTDREVVADAAVESVLRSLEAAISAGLGEDRIILSCKVSSPPELIGINRRLAAGTRQPLHLGLTEAGMGARGLLRSAAAMAPLLADGIGDTIRVSLTPTPGGRRADEVTAAREILQALGLRRFSATVTACPGCGRTAGPRFRELAERVESHLASRMSDWRQRRPGAEELRVAVMGCVVNGPGESAAADIGISLPDAGESPRCPVYVDGDRIATLRGDVDELVQRFTEIIDDYVAQRFPER